MKRRKRKQALWVAAFKRKTVNRKGERLTKYLEQRIDFLSKNRMCARCRSRRSTEVHHMRGRIATLLLDERGWAAVCNGCHRWIHWNINAARDAGLICQRGLWGKPFDRT